MKASWFRPVGNAWIRYRLGVMALVAAVTLAAFARVTLSDSTAYLSIIVPFCAGAVGWWCGLANMPLLSRLSAWIGALFALFASLAMIYGHVEGKPWSWAWWTLFFGDGVGLLIDAVATLLVFLAFRRWFARHGVIFSRPIAKPRSGLQPLPLAPPPKQVWDVPLLFGSVVYGVGLLIFVVEIPFPVWLNEGIRAAVDQPIFMVRLLVLGGVEGATKAVFLMSVSWAFLGYDRARKKAAFLLAAGGLYVGCLSVFGTVFVPGTSAGGTVIHAMTEVGWMAAAFGTVFVFLRILGYRVIVRTPEGESKSITDDPNTPE